MSVRSDAWVRTRFLLWPVNHGVWLKLVCIAFFIGGCMISPFGNDPSLNLNVVPAGMIPGIGLALLCIGIGYMLVSSLLQFVFVDCLSTGDFLLTKKIKARSGAGVSFFFFYLAVLLLMGLIAVITAYLLLFPAFYNGSGTLPFLTALFTYLVILLLLLLPLWILLILANDFVVPIMIVESCGVLSGWVGFFRLFQGRWTECIAYVGTKVLVTILIGIGIGLAAVLLGTVMHPLFSLLLLFGSSLLLMVPVVTFFRYYSLGILERLDPSFVLSEQKGNTELTTKSS